MVKIVIMKKRAATHKCIMYLKCKFVLKTKIHSIACLLHFVTFNSIFCTILYTIGDSICIMWCLIIIITGGLLMWLQTQWLYKLRFDVMCSINNDIMGDRMLLLY